MEDLRFVSILIGIVGALVGVYFRESLRKALRQKNIAAKLEAELYELTMGFAKSGEFFDMFAIGDAWRREREKAVTEGGTAAFAEVEKKWKAALERVRAKAEAGTKELDEALTRTHEACRKMPEALFRYKLERVNALRQSVSSHSAPISEDEAAEISWDTVSQIVAVRSSLLDLTDRAILLMLTAREIEEPDLSAMRTLIYEVVEQGIRLSRHLVPLMNKAKLVRATRVIVL